MNRYEEIAAMIVGRPEITKSTAQTANVIQCEVKTGMKQINAYLIQVGCKGILKLALDMRASHLL